MTESVPPRLCRLLGVCCGFLPVLAAGPVLAQDPAVPAAAQEPPPAPPLRLSQPITIGTAPVEKPSSPLRQWWTTTPEVGCKGCGFEVDPGWLPPRYNANAPWVVQGMARRVTRFGTLSAGVAGVRNLAAPLYTVAPGGGLIDTGPASASQGNLAVTATDWQARLAIERTLWKKGRFTVGFMVGGSMPISSAPAPGELARLDPLPSRALFVGFVLRW